MTMQRLIALATCVGMLLAEAGFGAEPRESRTWTSADGRFTVQATIVGHNGERS